MNILTRLYYSKDQKGILTRYLREKDFWDYHLQNCKQYILNSFEQKNCKKVAFLGSGWLLDIPIKQLINIAKEIHLFDIVHPAQTKHKYSKFKNINFHKIDLTGNLIYKAKKLNDIENIINLSETSIVDFNKYDFDLVVSLNILNQLDILVCDYLTRRHKIDTQSLNILRKNIQDNHIKGLPKGKSIIITDHLELCVNQNKQVIRKKNLIFAKLPQPTNLKEWQWVFDTKKRYRKEHNTIFEVKAFNF